MDAGHWTYNVSQWVIKILAVVKLQQLMLMALRKIIKLELLKLYRRIVAAHFYQDFQTFWKAS